MPTIERALAESLAAQWIAAWNSGDLERILALYDDDFEMRSPLIVERGFSSSGTLRGKDAVRPYWAAGIAAAAAAEKPISFELIDVYGGIDTVAIHYKSVGRKVVIEVLELDARGRVIRGTALHGQPA